MPIKKVTIVAKNAVFNEIQSGDKSEGTTKAI